jgi:hypothetical protein
MREVSPEYNSVAHYRVKEGMIDDFCQSVRRRSHMKQQMKVCMWQLLTSNAYIIIRQTYQPKLIAREAKHNKILVVRLECIHTQVVVCEGSVGSHIDN